MREYGLINVFRASTTVKTVKKRLIEYKEDFETSLTVADVQGKIGGLDEPQIEKSEDKKKEAESI